MVFVALRVTTEKIPSVMESYKDVKDKHLEKLLRKEPLYFHERYINGIMLDDLREYLDVERYIIGEECLNKEGKKTHIHFHLHLECRKDGLKKDTLQKHCRDKWGWRGKEIYAVQVLETLDDEERWWRYPLKEKRFAVEGDFSDMDLNQMEICAKDEKSRTVELLATSKERELMKNQFRDKMYSSFKKKYEGKDFVGNKILWCEIAKYYYDCGKTPPYNTLDNVVDDVKVYLGYMTVEDLYDLRHN